MATHPSILAWRIPWTQEPDGLYNSWGRKKSDATEQLTLEVSLSGKFHGQRSLVGYSPCSREESDMTECAHTDRQAPDIL